MKTLTIITGILTAILGIMAFTMPLRVFLGLGWILGALILVNGVETIIGAFKGKKDIWQCIFGIIIEIPVSHFTQFISQKPVSTDFCRIEFDLEFHIPCQSKHTSDKTFLCHIPCFPE